MFRAILSPIIPSVVNAPDAGRRERIIQALRVMKGVRLRGIELPEKVRNTAFDVGRR